MMFGLACNTRPPLQQTRDQDLHATYEITHMRSWQHTHSPSRLAVAKSTVVRATCAASARSCSRGYDKPVSSESDRTYGCVAATRRIASCETGKCKRRRRQRSCTLKALPSSGLTASPASSTHISTKDVPQQQEQPAIPQQQEQPAIPPEPQQHVHGMHQLLQQQQSAIAMLQQQVQELRWALEAQPTAPATYEGTYQGMKIEDFRALPDKIIMVRHAESQGNVDARTYSTTPDYEVPLSARGWEQAVACGDYLRTMLEAEHGSDYKLFFMTSPYCRTRQTFVGVRQAFPDDNFAGVQEEVQLREQDFGNFQDPVKIKNDLAERNRFGRFYYRFPDGESGSDVYNRISIFEDHLIRDMKAGKFSHNTNICLVTHGLTMRVFLMRWFNWTVESFLQVYNPPNAKPIVVEKMSEEEFVKKTTKLHVRRQTLQVKQAYRLRKDSMASLKMSPTATTDVIDLIGQSYLP